MNINKASRSFRTIMIEFVLMLAVLAIISVIIVKMFLSADRMAKDAQDYSKAIIKAENIAEYLKGSSSFEEALSNIGIERVIEGDKAVYQGYYGHDWEQSNEPGFYVITVYIEHISGNTGRLEKAEIIIARVKDQIKEDGRSDSLSKLNISKFVYN